MKLPTSEIKTVGLVALGVMLAGYIFYKASNYKLVADSRKGFEA